MPPTQNAGNGYVKYELRELKKKKVGLINV